MKPWITVVIGLCSAVVGYVVHLQISASETVSIQDSRFDQIELVVQKNIRQISDDIENRLSSFADAVAEDRVFSLRLLGEQDRSSPDVTQFASRFIKPMNFSILDIVDSSFSVVSSGQFTANAGSNVTEKISALEKKPGFYKDKIMGESVLTFQARKAFKIADIPFYVSGGCFVNKQFLEKVAPNDSCSLFLKIGDEIFGNDTIRTVSDLKGHTMIINDKKYEAVIVPVQSGTKSSPQIVVFF
jgi:hypothetical protein